MKNILIILAAILLCPGAAMAQGMMQGKETVHVTDIRMNHADGYVNVAFNFHAGKKATKKDYNLVVNPVLRKANSALPLPAIVVQGSRAKVSEERHRMATGEMVFSQPPVYTANGMTINYGTSFPYEEWMSGSQLVFEGVSVGCCSATEVQIGLIVDNILYTEPREKIEIVPVPVQVARQVEVEAPRVMPVGEQLAQQYSFVEPVNNYNRIRNVPYGLNERDHIISHTREGALSVRFAQGISRIDRNLEDNNQVLVKLISAIRTLNASTDSRVSHVIIAGFASPEGTLQFNDRLAWDRAVAVKEFLLMASGVSSEKVQLYNGSVDWKGLRDLVEASDMYEKRQVLDIIDYTPSWDSRRNVGRHGELMRLNGGRTYRYLLQTLFPKLRQAAFIKVYYETK